MMTLEQRKAAIAQFNATVDQATSSRPPSKQWVRHALGRKGAARCPVRLRRLTLDVILSHGKLLADLFTQYPDDVVLTAPYESCVGYQRPDAAQQIDTVQVLTESAQWVDEWGTGWSHSAEGVGATTISYPLEDWSQLDDYLARRMPRADEPGRLDGSLPALKFHGATRYVCGITHLALFERLHCLRGMEQTFEDFYVYPSGVERLLEALTQYLLVLIRRWGELGADAWLFTDDWGTQQTMMIAPDMWRRFFAQRYRRLFAEAHRCDMQVVMHSCGNVTAIIGDLVDAGLDVLDPLQPEAMDVAAVGRQYGRQLAFSGGISDQELVTFTPAQVKDHVRRVCDALGAGGNACILSPSNLLPPDIPAQNLVALFEACHS